MIDSGISEGQTLDLDGAGDDIHDAAVELHPFGFADNFNVDGQFEQAVHGDFEKIGMDQVPLDRIQLVILDHGVVLFGTVHAYGERWCFARFPNGELSSLATGSTETTTGCFPGAIDDGRNFSRFPEPSVGILAARGPRLSFDDCWHEIQLLPRSLQSPGSLLSGKELEARRLDSKQIDY